MLSLRFKFGTYVFPSRRVPRGFGSLLIFCFLFFVSLSGLYYGDYGSSVVDGAGQSLGLSSIEVSVEGNYRVSRSRVVSALGLDSSSSLASFDISAARRSVLSIPWVHSVEISTYFPSKVLVSIIESRAYATWEHSGSLTLVRDDGFVIDRLSISDLSTGEFNGLVHLVGSGAASHASDILPVVSSFPSLSSRVLSYERIEDRRWDILLDNNVRIMLPAINFASSLSYLADLDSSYSLLDREISVIDLRLSDRIVLRLTPTGLASHHIVLSERTKSISGGSGGQL